MPQIDDIVMVPVPRSRLQDVYSLLGGSGARARAGSPKVAGGEWTLSAFALIAEEPRKSGLIISQVLDVLAESADTAVAYSDLVDRLGISSNSLRGAFGGFTKIANGLGLPMPFHVIDNGTSNTRYILGAAHAATWKAVRAAA